MSAEIHPIKLPIKRLIDKADGLPGVTTFESQIRGMYQIIDSEEALIITANQGYLRLSRKDIPAFIEELENIYKW